MLKQEPVSAKPWKYYALYSSIPRGWNPLETFHTEGQGWKAVFRISGPEVPFIRMKADETLDIRTDSHPGPCVEIIVDTAEMDSKKAFTIGRPITNIITAILTHRLSTQIINKKIWAGIMGTRADSSYF